MKSGLGRHRIVSAVPVLVADLVDCSHSLGHAVKCVHD